MIDVRRRLQLRSGASSTYFSLPDHAVCARAATRENARDKGLG